MSPAAIRPLTTADLPGLLAVQLACYGPEFVEGAEVFARRLASPANCSLVAERGGRVVAYLAAYRTQRGKLTPLHGDFDGSPDADTLYLHDLAVHPDGSGQGLARALLTMLWKQALAAGVQRSALVSVQGSQTYWERQGFAVQPLACAAQRQRLAGYGAGAVYMERAPSNAVEQAP